MHAVRYGLFALGISICLGSSPATAQTRHQAASHPPDSSHRRSEGHRSEGLLGAWMQPSDDDSPSLLERFGIGGSSRQEPPDWDGVPYHRPVPPTGRKTSVPITDPGSPTPRTASRPTNRSGSRPDSRPDSRSTSPSRSSAARSDLAVPVPPAEDASSRRSTAASSRGSSGPATASAAPAAGSARSAAPADSPAAQTAPARRPLSSTESSRRSGRRPVDPLDAYLQSPADAEADSTAAADSQRSDGAPSKSDEPRVARRPVPAADTPAADTRTADAPASSRRSRSAATPSLPPSLAASGDALTDDTASTPENGPALEVPAIGREADAMTPQTAAAATAAPREATADSSFAVPTPSPRASSGVSTDLAETATNPTANAQPTGDAQPNDDAWQASAATSTATSRSTTTNPSAAAGQFAVPTGSGLAASNDSSQPRMEVGSQSMPSTDGSPTSGVVNAPPISVAGEIPGVRVVTSGPGEIPIRRPASYQVRVENRGSIPAPGALVRLSLPRWINVHGQQASRGDVDQGGDEAERQLLWQIDGLAAGAAETLTLQLSAVEARQFDLAVEWAVLPESNVASVKVHEPKLELLIEGPEKVVYGQSQAYKVRVLNPGNGVAEDVVFTLSPNSTPQSQRIGKIPPGKEAHFEVELTARDLENLQIHGLAVGNSALKAEAIKSIEVIAAELEAVLSGPPLRYQDSSATYKLELTNLGEAASEQVSAVLRLPSGVKYEGGLPGAEASGSGLQWRIDRLPAGESIEYEFTCAMQRTGQHEIAFECEGSAAGATRVVFTTEVEAIADLVLAVNNPPAPAPVGEEVLYEIVLRNRGSKAATDVETLAQFSHNIEPVRVEGGKGQIGSGQVLFDPIPQIDAGGEVRLQVYAKADKSGIHRFRTEIRSGGEAVLVSEESTRYVELDGQRVSRRSSEEPGVK